MVVEAERVFFGSSSGDFSSEGKGVALEEEGDFESGSKARFSGDCDFFEFVGDLAFGLEGLWVEFKTPDFSVRESLPDAELEGDFEIGAFFTFLTDGVCGDEAIGGDFHDHDLTFSVSEIAEPWSFLK